MATIVFVHGTGVRQGYDTDLALIREQLRDRLPELNVAPCHWAAADLGLRAELGHHGAAIPTGRFARGDMEEDDATVALWGQLYADPLYELRLLAVLAADPATDSAEGRYQAELADLASDLASFAPSSGLTSMLEQAGLQDVFATACSDTAASDVLAQISADGRQEPELVQSAVARAAIAAAIQQTQLTSAGMPRAAIDGDLRDSLVTRVSMELSGATADRGIQDWMKQGVVALLSHSATWYLRRDSSVATHFAFPFSGDILRYQRDGAAIRSFVRETIAAAEPPVIVLAHSLGGVICFDLLCLEDLRTHVTGLITVGSQAPLLYEMNVLAGLAFGTPLPAQVPRWLNIYDQRDMLSFVGEQIFPGRIEDYAVDNRQPFPHAHVSYWANPHVWQKISAWMA